MEGGWQEYMEAAAWCSRWSGFPCLGPEGFDPPWPVGQIRGRETRRQLLLQPDVVHVVQEEEDPPNPGPQPQRGPRAPSGVSYGLSAHGCCTIGRWTG
jgi:hypothetical protein